MNNNSIEYKSISFNLKEVKQVDDKRGKFGIIIGHAAAFTTDRGLDKIEPGAFIRTLAEHRERDRKIRMKFQHSDMELIGGFDANKAFEDEFGLVVEGEINLEVQRGREALALAKQGVLSDMSIGFNIRESDIENEIRILREIELFEISLVGEPMNRNATITEVKKHNLFYTIADLKEALKTNKCSEFEKLLRDTGAFSKTAAEYIAANFYKGRVHLAEPDQVVKNLQDSNQKLLDELLITLRTKKVT